MLHFKQVGFIFYIMDILVRFNFLYNVRCSNTSNISTSCLSNYAIVIIITFEELVAAKLPRFSTNWHDGNNFPSVYGSGIYIPGLDANNGYMIYFVGEKLYTRCMGGGVWGDWKQMI